MILNYSYEYLHHTHSVLAPYMLHTCSVHAPYPLRTCSVPAPYMLRTRSVLNHPSHPSHCSHTATLYLLLYITESFLYPTEIFPSPESLSAFPTNSMMYLPPVNASKNTNSLLLHICYVRVMHYHSVS